MLDTGYWLLVFLNKAILLDSSICSKYLLRSDPASSIQHPKITQPLETIRLQQFYLI